jgi:ubiquinone biosynthesis protein UbiJ
MTPDDIIKMAKEAGAYAPKYPIGPHDVQFSVASLEHFFRMAQEAEADRITNESKHIIKRAEARGAAAEREACVALCERLANRMMSAEECADAIRARGEQ